MSEDMNKELETEVKAEEPVETMEDYAAELEASYAALDQRRDMPRTTALKDRSGLSLLR